MFNRKNNFQIPRNTPLPVKQKGLLECVPTCPSVVPGYAQLSGPGQ